MKKGSNRAIVRVNSVLIKEINHHTRQLRLKCLNFKFRDYSIFRNFAVNLELESLDLKNNTILVTVTSDSKIRDRNLNEVEFGFYEKMQGTAVIDVVTSEKQPQFQLNAFIAY